MKQRRERAPAANRYLKPGPERSAGVRALFAVIARRYDLVNDLQSAGLHRLWKRALVRLAAPRPGALALDVCCGTGDLSQALARRGASVVGLDFSGPMLHLAEARSRRAPAPRAGRCRFVLGDAERIPCPDGAFDIVSAGYGLRNLSDWRLGLSELARVVKPGGRVLVLDFGRPENAVGRALVGAYLRYVLPVLGRIFLGDAEAYAYLFESLKNYPDPRELAAAMTESGLTNIRVVRHLGGLMTIHAAEKERRLGAEREPA